MDVLEGEGAEPVRGLAAGGKAPCPRQDQCKAVAYLLLVGLFIFVVGEEPLCSRAAPRGGGWPCPDPSASGHKLSAGGGSLAWEADPFGGPLGVSWPWAPAGGLRLLLGAPAVPLGR